MSLILILFVCSISFAQTDTTSEHRIDSELSVCFDSNLSTHGMLECIYEAEEKWNSEMKKYLNSISNLISGEALKKFLKSQTIWEKFKNYEIKMLSELYKQKEGTMYQILMADDVMQITRTRVLDLINYYEMLNIE